MNRGRVPTRGLTAPPPDPWDGTVQLAETSPSRVDAIAASMILTGAIAESSPLRTDAAVADMASTAAVAETSPVRTDAATAEVGFSPTDISGCVAWIDMQDAAAFAETAGTITSITNKASATAWTTGTLPTYQATGLNSLPCMDFNGTTQSIGDTESAVLAALDDSSAHTIFFVVAHDDPDAARSVFGIGNSGQATASSRAWGTAGTGSGVFRCISRNSSNTQANADSTGVPGTSPQVEMWISTGTATSHSTNDAARDPSGATQNPGTLTPDRFRIACRPVSTPDLFFNGRLGELLIYNVELSGADEDLIWAYLLDKWNLP